MEIFYHSSIETIELIAGTPVCVVPAFAYLEIRPEKKDASAELFADGKYVDKSSYSHFECSGDIKLVVIDNDKNKTSEYSIKSLTGAIKKEFADAYEDFGDELSRVNTYEISNVINKKVKLYAVEQRLDIDDFSEILKSIDKAYNAFRKICDQPKSHLKSVNEVRPIETVKRVGYESIPYLASHSEDWLAKTASGLKPSRLLSRTEDDEFQIYENRVVKTLLDIICRFLKEKITELKTKGNQLSEIINYNVQTNSFGFDKSFARSVSELLDTSSEKIDSMSKQYVLAQKLSEEATKQWKRYRDLKRSRLYRYLKTSKPVANPLKETNILLLDKKYSIIYKLWTPMQRVIAPKQLEVGEIKDYSGVAKHYASYCKVLSGYAAHTLGFDESDPGVFVRSSDKTRIIIGEIDGGIIKLSVEDNSENELIIERELYCPIQKGETYKKFRYDGQKLFWHKDASDAEINDFCSLLKKGESSGKDKIKEKNHFSTLKQHVVDINKKTAIPSYHIAIVPVFCELKENPKSSFADYMSEKTKSLVKDGKYDLVVIALPKIEENELRIIDYARQNDKNMAVLPLTMFDINSYRRIQNVMLRYITLLNNGHCPYCGGAIRGKDNMYKCTNEDCNLIITTTICGNKGCKQKFVYLSYDVNAEVMDEIEKVTKEDMDIANFNSLDSLYQYKNIVDLTVNKRIVPICPKCGK